MPPRSTSHRLALSLLILAALVILLWAAFFRTERHVETVTIGRGDIEVSVTALGTLQPRRYVDVGAQASGEIRRIALEPGSVVKKGDLLVEIDPAVQCAKVDTDPSALDSQYAQLNDAWANRDLVGEEPYGWFCLSSCYHWSPHELDPPVDR